MDDSSGQPLFSCLFWPPRLDPVRFLVVELNLHIGHTFPSGLGCPSLDKEALAEVVKCLQDKGFGISKGELAKMKDLIKTGRGGEPGMLAMWYGHPSFIRTISTTI